MSQQTVATVRRFYDALRAGDVEAALGTFDPDVEVVTPELPWSRGHYQGREGAAEYFQGVLTHLEEPGLDPEEILADGDRAVAFGAMYGRVRATGTEFSVRFVHIWTVRDGLIVRTEGVSDSAPVSRAFQAQADPATA